MQKSEIKQTGNKMISCNDKNCNIHGNLKTRGKVFWGNVVKKFHKRVVIEFERMVYDKKYERYYKNKTKIHARLPLCIGEQINIGDYIEVRECKPLSKLVHFVVTKRINPGENKK